MFDNLFAMFAALGDCRAGIPLATGIELFISAKLGLPPAPQDSSHPETSRALEVAGKRRVVEELDRDAAVAQEESPAWAPLLGPFMLVLVLVELVGAYDFLGELELADVSRLLLSVGATAVIFALTFLAANSDKRSDADSDGQPAAGRGNLVLLAYALMVIAATALRFTALGEREDATDTSDMAGAVLLLGATIGPAALAKLLMPHWIDSRGKRSNFVALRGKHLQAAKDVAAADAHLSDTYTAPAAWAARNTRLRALYTRAYHRAQHLLSK